MILSRSIRYIWKIHSLASFHFKSTTFSQCEHHPVGRAHKQLEPSWEHPLFAHPFRSFWLRSTWSCGLDQLRSNARQSQSQIPDPSRASSSVAAGTEVHSTSFGLAANKFGSVRFYFFSPCQSASAFNPPRIFIAEIKKIKSQRKHRFWPVAR